MEPTSPDNPNQPQPAEPVSRPIVGTPIAGRTTQVVLVQQPNSFIRRWAAWLGWVGFFFCVMILLGMMATLGEYFNTEGGLQEKHFSGPKQLVGKKVAIISVTGVIGDGSGFVKKQIDRVTNDEDVEAVVLRVNSPGGTITGSDYIYHHLKKMLEKRDIPLVVSMGSIAASGGYYVAMAVGDQKDAIFAEPTTTTGSIGVIIPHYDLSGLMERLDVKEDSLATHPRKKMLSMSKPISDDDRLVLDEYLQTAFDRFKDIVKSGRPAFREDESLLDELATGEIFAAGKAKDKGLVDQLGFIEEAIDRAKELAGLDEDTRVVKYQSTPTLMDAFGMVKSNVNTSFKLESLLEGTAPKAYYLCTSLPPLFSITE